MSNGAAAAIGLLVLSAAGLVPVVALVGLRWITVPLVPLGGAVVSALAATAYVATGGTFMGWYVGLSLFGVVVVVAYWGRFPQQRPWWSDGPNRDGPGTWYRLSGGIGAGLVAVTCVWGLRGLTTPTVGFDARALWLMRPGWFLQNHHQLLIDLRLPALALIQTSYPPLVSSATAVAWSVSGNHSIRVGVIVVALLNTGALAAAAFWLVECGRTVARRLRPAATVVAPSRSSRRDPSPDLVSLAPVVVGVAAAVLLVFIAFGITTPFITNGYADPIWSLAAVGAVAYGLQSPLGRSQQGTALLFVLVAGLSKDEGLATAVALIAIIALRTLMAMPAPVRRRSWWKPVVVAVVELGLIGTWRWLMGVDHARGASMGYSPVHAWPGRVHATYDGMSTYLHVLWLAVPLAVVGGLVLSRVRRSSGIANDWWAWAGLVSGIVTVGAAFITGTGAIAPWLSSTVHRVTEFPALAGWWIIAVWAVVASGALVVNRSQAESATDTPASSGQQPLADDGAEPLVGTETAKTTS